ncbi:hypothetical protein [Phenylobacterium sp.]|jgi:hypothetical protein|uniref:hypothetical protein n=1 Tax=Phenylobacterium sp. TaxID=1871053 RepID=UPI0037CA1792
MPQVTYLVEFAGDAWWIDLEGKRFGPYSSLDTVMAAASRAAHKAEAQGYEAMVNVRSPEDKAA